MIAEFWDCLRLDPAPVQTLRQKYEDHVNAKGRPELVIDLLGVGYAGSAALGHFMALQRVTRHRGGRLIFCNVDPTVFEVFRVSKLDTLFDFSTDRPAALAMARGETQPASAAGADGTTPGGSPAAHPVAPPRPKSVGSLRNRRKKLSEG